MIKNKISDPNICLGAVKRRNACRQRRKDLKLYILSIFLLFSGVLQATEKPKEIISFQLNPQRVYLIDTYLAGGVTTVMFPGQIEGIAAGNVAMNEVHYNVDGSPACDFLMAFKPGNYYFSIRALKPEVSGTVNVIYGRQTYILKFRENEAEAMSNVTFSDENQAEEEQDFRPPSVAVLKGLLDKAKSFNVLKEKYPAAVSQVTVCDNRCVSDYGNYTATVVKAWRFDSYNSLVFMVELKNKTKKTLLYKAEKTAFMVLDQRLYPVLIDASGVMPSESTTAAFFVVSSTADGRKNKFAADNDWKVLIDAKTGEMK